MAQETGRKKEKERGREITTEKAPRTRLKSHRKGQNQGTKKIIKIKNVEITRVGICSSKAEYIRDWKIRWEKCKKRKKEISQNSKIRNWIEEGQN